MLSGDTAPRSDVLVFSHTMTSRSGWRKGSARRSVASTRAKSALFAPMPSASVRTATSVNAGEPLSWRTANFTSSLSCSSHWVRDMLDSVLVDAPVWRAGEPLVAGSFSHRHPEDPWIVDERRQPFGIDTRLNDDRVSPSARHDQELDMRTIRLCVHVCPFPLTGRRI